MNNSNIRVTAEEIDALINEAEINVTTVFDKCTVVSVKLKNGFVLTESSACVDKANYNVEIGKKACLERIKNKLWELEGYYLQKEFFNKKEAFNKRIEKFLFVEDGTVDVDELTETLSKKNPEIYVVVYRQGGRQPELINNPYNLLGF